MSKLTGLQRKLVYLVGILVLFIPIIVLGRPDEGRTATGGDQGGTLARMRREYDLKESSLGKVDPASASMNLVLLGMRGIAANILWQQAIDLQKTKNWAELRAVTESITQLQPHFLKVWDMQAWNLAYNVSAEWDLVRDRYFWVKEGLKFYQQGVLQNQKYGEMQWRTGNTYSQKIGRADEWKQFRQYFVKDPNTEAFPSGLDPEINPEGKDNYQVAEKWFRDANRTIDDTGIEQHVMGRPLFRSYPVRAMIEFAQAKQREGVFGDITKQAWETAAIEWSQKYGKEEFDSPGGMVHLEVTEKDAKEMQDRGEDDKLNWVYRYQDMCNYRYWRLRCFVEREQNTVDARRDLYNGEVAAAKGDFVEARKLLESGMEKYDTMIRKYPELLEQMETVEDAMVAMIAWRSVLQIESAPVPDDYPLKSVWEQNAGSVGVFNTEYIRRKGLYNK
jgi:hypothetical protein